MKIDLLASDAERMTLRSELEAAGCEVVGIDSQRNGLQVQIERGFFAAILAHAARLGAEVTEMHYFPIGSAQIADRYRHDGGFPGSRGNTLNALVVFERAEAFLAQ